MGILDAPAVTRKGLTSRNFNGFGPLKALLASGNVSGAINLLGDSTGDATNEWFYRFGSYLAGLHPEWTVKHMLWNDSNQDYDAPTTIQTGTGGERCVQWSTASSYTRVWARANVTHPTDLDIAVKVALDDWTPDAVNTLFAHNGASGSRGFYFHIGPDGRPNLTWSNDGTTLITIVASAAPTVSDGETLWVRVTLDVDDGSGNRVGKFYTSTDGATWTQLGSSSVTAGTTSVNNPTGVNYEIGGRQALVEIINGKIYEVHFRSGINGASIAPHFPEHWTAYDSRSPQATGAPVLMLVNGSKGGAGIGYWTNSTRLPILLRRYGSVATFMSTSHNDTNVVERAWTTQIRPWITAIQGYEPSSKPIFILQNPRRSPADWVEEHRLRRIQTMGVCASDFIDYIDVFKAFMDSSTPLSTLVLSDGVHPSDPDGIDLWTNTVKAAYNATT